MVCLLIEDRYAEASPDLELLGIRSCKAHLLQRVRWSKLVRYSAFWEGGAGRIPFISSSLSGPPATFQGEACVPSMRSPKVDSLVPARDACQPIVGHWGWPT